MPDPNFTEIVLVLDASGSMMSMRDEAVQGVNSFINSQRTGPGRVSFSLVVFNTMIRKALFSGVSLDSLCRLDQSDYLPQNGTPLWDAVGDTIDEVGARLAAMPSAERPSKILFVVMTDGEENSSQRWSQEKLKTKIEEQKTKYGWQFLYLAKDPTQFSEFEGVKYTSGSYGTLDPAMRMSFEAIATAATAYRGGTVLQDVDLDATVNPAPKP